MLPTVISLLITLVTARVDATAINLILSRRMSPAAATLPAESDAIYNNIRMIALFAMRAEKPRRAASLLFIYFASHSRTCSPSTMRHRLDGARQFIGFIYDIIR